MKPTITPFFIGILFCLAIRGCTEKFKSTDVKEVKKQINSSAKMVETIDKQYKSSTIVFGKAKDSLKRENDKLNKQLQSTRQLLKQQQQLVISNIPCDTLRKEVVVLNQLTNAQDSLCSLSNSTLIEAVEVRDSQLVMCNRNYLSMYELQKVNLLRQQQLADELNVAYKQSRRNRFENKMLTCGLLIMSGITTTLFIKSQQ
jgi:hypothetical protein